MKDKPAIFGKNGSSQALDRLTAHSKLATVQSSCTKTTFCRLRKSKESHLFQEERKISNFLGFSIVLHLNAVHFLVPSSLAQHTENTILLKTN